MLADELDSDTEHVTMDVGIDKNKSLENDPSRNPKSRYMNKQRTLVLSARGIGARERHLMNDIIDLLPHSRKDVKVDSKKDLQIVNELAEMKNCNNCIYFELKNRKDLFMWVARTPNGPSMKFSVENVHTMDELKLTGNCLKGSRPILSFDNSFDENAPAHLQVMKTMFTQAMGSPKGHPNSKPFVDHVFSFSYLDGKVWFRNFQIVYDADAKSSLKNAKKADPVLVEVGPRFVLNPIKILAGSFSGETLFANPSYNTPMGRKQALKRKQNDAYLERVVSKVSRNMKKKEAMEAIPKSEVDTVFE